MYQLVPCSSTPSIQFQKLITALLTRNLFDIIVHRMIQTHMITGWLEIKFITWDIVVHNHTFKFLASILAGQPLRLITTQQTTLAENTTPNRVFHCMLPLPWQREKVSLYTHIACSYTTKHCTYDLHNLHIDLINE